MSTGSIDAFVKAGAFSNMSRPIGERAERSEQAAQTGSTQDRLVLSAAGKKAASGLEAVFSPSSEQSSGLNPAGTDASGHAASAGEFAVERLKEQLAELQEKMAKLRQELQQIQQEPASEARDQKMAMKQKEIALVQTQITQMNTELTKLNEEGGGGGGASGSTQSASSIAHKQALGG